MPVSVIPTSPQGYDCGVSGYPTPYLGFEYAGRQYLFLQQSAVDVGGDALLHAFKSTDQGMSWVQQDSLNSPNLTPAPPPGDFAGEFQVAFARDGDKVIAVAAISHLYSSPFGFQIDGLKVWKFNLSTDTWIAPITFSPIVQPVWINNAVGDFSISAVYMRLVVRAANDYIFYFSGVPDIVAGKQWGRLWYATFDGTTFGTPVKIPNQVTSGAYAYVGTGAVVDPAGVTHFMYLSGDTTQPTTLFHVGMNAALAFGTTQTLPDGFLYWSNSGITNASCSISPPIVYTPSGGVETISLVTEIFKPGDPSHQQEVIYTAATALNPTWSHSLIYEGVDDSGGTGDFVVSDETLFPVPQAFTFLGGSVVLTESNGKLVVSWVVNKSVAGQAFGSIYYTISPSNALSWPAEVKLFDNGPIINSHEVGGKQLWSFPMAIGVGVVGMAADLDTGSPVFSAEIAQFSVILVGGTTGPSCSLTSFVTAPSRGTPPSGLQLVLFGGNGKTPGAAPGFGNVYTVPADPLGAPLLLADDDYGQIDPYYVTYFFVNHEQEQALQLGSHRKMLSYFQAAISGVGNITITALMNILSQPWPIAVTRALVAEAIVDLEWPGASATAQRMAFKFASTPGASSAGGGTATLTWTTAGTPTSAFIDNGIGAVNPAGGSLTIPLPGIPITYHLTVSNSMGTSNCQTTVTPPSANSSFELQKVVATMKPVTHMPVRGST